MPRLITTLLALSMAACLEVSTDPHQPGGTIPLLPPSLDIGRFDASFDLNEIQAQFAGDPSSPALPNQITDPIAPIAPQVFALQPQE